MDLIVMDKERFEIGILPDFKLDVDVANKKDFELKTLINNPYILKEGYWFYIDGTEYGGRIDSISHDTESDEITYTGRNFRGILETKIIEPVGNYWISDGNAQNEISEIIENVGLQELFAVDATEIEINQFQHERYCSVYSGIKKMLESVNAKMVLRYNAKDSKVHIYVELINDYSDYLVYCKDNSVNFKITSGSGGVNHLICLGQGELEERYIIHLFTDENGNIQDYATTEYPVEDSDYILDKSKQLLVGLDEITVVYNLSNAGMTENYVLLDKIPSNWQKKYESYYELNSDGTDYMEVVTVESYALLNSQPADWSSKYQNYYTKSSSKYSPVEAVVLSSKYVNLKIQPSDWQKKYSSYFYFYNDGVTSEYRKVEGVSYDVYKKHTRKPTDWQNNYSSYYYITKNSKGKKVYESVKAIGRNKTVPKWRKNKYYTKYTHKKAPKFRADYHKKYVEVVGAPTFTTNKYYAATESAPTFTKGTYYRKAYDHYAMLVEDGIKKLQELAAAESQSVQLTEFDASIGDVVGGADEVSGIEICEKVTNMIVKIENEVINVEYEIGGES